MHELSDAFDFSGLRQAGLRVAEKVRLERKIDEGYTLELALEAFLELYATTGDAAYYDYVLGILFERGWMPETHVSYFKQPFNCLTYEVYCATQDAAYLPVFLDETEAFYRETPRANDGLVLHPRGESRGGGNAVLIDSMQCYVSRMAAAGQLTGDTSRFDDSLEQILLHRVVLRDERTGLWSQGRGWLAPGDTRLSPGAWSRGHGWLVRGLEKTLRVLPPDSHWANQTADVLRETADALLPLQTPSGLWHTLLHRSPKESPPDTSGTALVAFHLLRAHQAGWLPDEKYRAAAHKALHALPRFVRPDATVESASPGPGPLQTEAPWQVASFPPDDPHGTFAMLFAFAAIAAPVAQSG